MLFVMHINADIDATKTANPHVILPSAASFKYPPKRKTDITDTTINARRFIRISSSSW